MESLQSLEVLILNGNRISDFSVSVREVVWTGVWCIVLACEGQSLF